MSIAPEVTKRARLGAHDHARPFRIDRLARNAHLPVGIAVVLENLDRPLAGFLLDLFGQRDARPQRQLAFEIFTLGDRKHVKALESKAFNRDGIRRRGLRRRMPAGADRRGGNRQRTGTPGSHESSVHKKDGRV